MSLMKEGEKITTTKTLGTYDFAAKDLPAGTRAVILEVVKPEPYAECITEDGVRFRVYGGQFENQR